MVSETAALSAIADDLRCSGAVVALGEARFEYLGIVARGVACLPPDGESSGWSRWATEAGDVSTLEELTLADRSAFRAAGAVDPALREQLAGSKSAGSRRVHVWFAAPLPEEPSPDDASVDERLVAEFEAERDGAILAAADSLIRRIADRRAAVAAEGLRVVSQRPDDAPWGPPRLVVDATPEEIEWLARQEEVVDVLPDPGPGAPAVPDCNLPTTSPDEPYCDDYFDLVRGAWLDNFGTGKDGTNVTVAILEGDRFDSIWNLPGVPGGACTLPSGGLSYKCHCPDGAVGSHPRAMAGFIRNNIVWDHGADGPTAHRGGLADDARPISANWGGGCASHGPDAYSSAVAWGLAEGARIFNMSWYWAGGTPQTSTDRLFDWYAAASPYPFFAACAGNDGPGTPAGNNLRNGLVVGGSDHAGANPMTREASVLWDPPDPPLPAKPIGSQSRNYNGYAGHEVPHVVAPATEMRTAGSGPGGVVVTGATSSATAVVSGLAASLMELNPALIGKPELMMAGLMAGADEDVDFTPLSLTDTTDDFDGAGLVNGLDSMFILDAASQRNGGAAPVAYAHDQGTMLASQVPASHWYAETWRAAVAPGSTLRAALTWQAKPTCGNPPSEASCTATSFAKLGLYAYHGNTWLTGTWTNENNYVYWTYENTGGSTKNLDLKISPLSWGGLTSTRFAIAWVAE